MPTNEAPNEIGRPRSTQDDACCRIGEALINHERDSQRTVIDARCKKKSFGFFQEAEQRPMENVHTSIYEAIK